MKALLLIDIQNDFLPGGALAVTAGEQIIPVVNELQKDFDLIIATQDWHPPDHASFAANHPGHKPGEIIDLDGLKQVLWPVHCVQNTPGAKFSPALKRTRVAHVIQKGTDPQIDSYSGFFDNARRKSTGLKDYLDSKYVKELFIAGLATDYCVKFTALDAISLGFKTHLLAQACRGVDLHPNDVLNAIEEMRKAGVQVLK